jgi:hypothetical protein
MVTSGWQAGGFVWLVSSFHPRAHLVGVSGHLFDKGITSSGVVLPPQAASYINKFPPSRVHQTHQVWATVC